MGNQPKTVMKMVNADSGLPTWLGLSMFWPYPLKYWQVEGEKKHMHLQGNGGGGGRGEIRAEWKRVDLSKNMLYACTGFSNKTGQPATLYVVYKKFSCHTKITRRRMEMNRKPHAMLANTFKRKCEQLCSFQNIIESGVGRLFPTYLRMPQEQKLEAYGSQKQRCKNL